MKNSCSKQLPTISWKQIYFTIACALFYLATFFILRKLQQNPFYSKIIGFDIEGIWVVSYDLLFWVIPLLIATHLWTLELFRNSTSSDNCFVDNAYGSSCTLSTRLACAPKSPVTSFAKPSFKRALSVKPIPIALIRAIQISVMMIIISPVFGIEGAELYCKLPIIQNIVFVIGIATFFTILLLFAVLNLKLNTKPQSVLAFLYIMMCLSFVLSYFELLGLLKGIAMDQGLYYATLFFAGGEMVRFIHSHLLIIGIASFFKKNIPILLIINVALALIAFMLQVLFTFMDIGLKEYYSVYVNYAAPVMLVFALSVYFLNKLTVAK